MRCVCTFCDAELDSDKPGVYQFARGWVRNRRQGGGNAVRLIARDNVYACHACIEARVKGNANNRPLW